jgi:serine/threonine protein kinase
MAPEQLLSGATVSERTDLFALGLVLYELLVGRRTFDQATSAHHLPPPSTIVDGVDRGSNAW